MSSHCWHPASPPHDPPTGRADHTCVWIKNVARECALVTGERGAGKRDGHLSRRPTRIPAAPVHTTLLEAGILVVEGAHLLDVPPGPYEIFWPAPSDRRRRLGTSQGAPESSPVKSSSRSGPSYVSQKKSRILHGKRLFAHSRLFQTKLLARIDILPFG